MRRIDTLTPSKNGKASKPADGRRAKRIMKAKPVADAKPWAYAGVGLTLGLSGWLNGLAFSATAPSPAAGWALGVAIPVLVLVFSRVSALMYLAGRRVVATAGAAACLSILGLSVQHLATAIALLTGEYVALAALMAVAVDAGLVVCELATLKK